MKVIVAGCRHITGCDAEPLVREAVHASGWFGLMTEVVSGAAPGIDAAGELWARQCTNFAVKRFPADWTKHGRAAGPIRNRRMAEYADALVAVWDGKSKGTANMIETMRAMGKPVYVHRVE